METERERAEGWAEPVEAKSGIGPPGLDDKSIFFNLFYGDEREVVLSLDYKGTIALYKKWDNQSALWEATH